jgi:monofunctional biosynthetic peptidoglycan transglycosylase
MMKRLRQWASFFWQHKVFTVFLLVLIWFVAEIGSLPFLDVIRLKHEKPGETAFMRMHEEEALERGTKFVKRQFWVSLKRVPRTAINAVIVAEDGMFWSHEGFDWFEFQESLKRNLSEGKAVRGASTITQQLVKNLYLSPSKDPIRKLKEWILTWWIELNLSKARILEIYLNVIEWGPGVYGIEAGSEYQFGKPVGELTREECARLAAVIPSPRRYRATAERGFVPRYSRMILERMDARGM